VLASTFTDSTCAFVIDITSLNLLQCPQYVNPADFLMEKVNTDFDGDTVRDWLLLVQMRIHVHHQSSTRFRLIRSVRRWCSLLLKVTITLRCSRTTKLSMFPQAARHAWAGLSQYGI